MPVLLIRCPDCDHRYRSLVAPGARVPKVWVCSKCRGRDAQPVGQESESPHPWSAESMDDCCS